MSNHFLGCVIENHGQMDCRKLDMVVGFPVYLLQGDYLGITESCTSPPTNKLKWVEVYSSNTPQVWRVFGKHGTCTPYVKGYSY